MRNIRPASVNTGRKTDKRPSLSRLMLVIAGFLLLWTMVGPYSIVRFYMLQGEVRAAEKSNAIQADENRRLSEEIENFKNDPVVQERYVRSRLKWVRDGEILYLFKQTR